LKWNLLSKTWFLRINLIMVSELVHRCRPFPYARNLDSLGLILSANVGIFWIGTRKTGVFLWETASVMAHPYRILESSALYNTRNIERTERIEKMNFSCFRVFRC